MFLLKNNNVYSGVHSVSKQIDKTVYMATQGIEHLSTPKKEVDPTNGPLAH